MKNNLSQPLSRQRQWIKCALSVPLMLTASIQGIAGMALESPSIAGERTFLKTTFFDIPISGTITDSKGEPIPGVTVMVMGTTIGTATDLDGRYQLEVPEGATLVFSFIGYVTQNVPVGQQSVINVSLAEDTASLDEVVVIGYGTAKKSDLTGSVARINLEDKATQANVNLFQALVGASPGINL